MSKFLKDNKVGLVVALAALAALYFFGAFEGCNEVTDASVSSATVTTPLLHLPSKWYKPQGGTGLQVS